MWRHNHLKSLKGLYPGRQFAGMNLRLCRSIFLHFEAYHTDCIKNNRVFCQVLQPLGTTMFPSSLREGWALNSIIMIVGKYHLSDFCSRSKLAIFLFFGFRCEGQIMYRGHSSTMTGKVWAIQIICIFTVISNLCAGETYSATVRKIIDGDSLLVAVGQDTVEVRLYGVDCPEYDQPFSRDAKQFAGEKVLRKQVLIRPSYNDSYGRVVAEVIRGDMVLNEELVQAGLAWVSPRYCKKSFCSSWQESENIARNERRGLWRDDRPDPPWQWKRMKKK